MKKLGYFTLRKQIFVHELKHMLRQIRHLLLFSIMFLGTAVPVLLFLSLLAFGVILDNDTSTTQAMFVAWAVLLAQTLMLIITKQAILGSRYQFYLCTLEKNAVKRVIADFALAFLCNPLVILFVFILLSISPTRWADIPHAFLFLGLMLGGSYVVLYKPKGLFWFLGAVLCSIPLLSSQSLEFGLLVFCIIQVLCLVLFSGNHSFSSKISFSLPIEWMFWLSLLIGVNNSTSASSASAYKANNLLNACAVSLILIIMTYYSEQSLPTYSQAVIFIGAQFIVLCTASLQISTQKLMSTYPLFFASFCFLFLFLKALELYPLALLTPKVFKQTEKVVFLLDLAECFYVYRPQGKISE